MKVSWGYHFGLPNYENSTAHFNKSKNVINIPSYLLSKGKKKKDNTPSDNIIFLILFPTFLTAYEDYSILQIHSGFTKHSSHVTESYAIFDFCNHRNITLRAPGSYTHCTKPSA